MTFVDTKGLFCTFSHKSQGSVSKHPVSNLAFSDSRDLLREGKITLTPANRESFLSKRCFMVRAITEADQALVVNSWNAMKPNAEEISFKFFMKAFEIAPSAKNLFSFLRDSDVPMDKNPKLKAHALTVFVMTCDAAEQFCKTGKLVLKGSTLKDLGSAHFKSGILDEHFEVIRYAMLDTIKDALPDMWTDDMGKAWGSVYDKLATAIKSEMKPDIIITSDTSY